MRSHLPQKWHFAALFAVTNAASNSTSLADLCTVANIQAALPANGSVLGLNLQDSKVEATAIYNSSAASTNLGAPTSSANYPYCNATITYTHPGERSEFVVVYAFPQPADFQNRFYLAGGGGYQLSTSNTGGLGYGAASGYTSAGYDAFSHSLDEVVLDGNGSINWDNVNAFSYQALGEMTVLGKAIIRELYNLSGETKIFTYFEGCSDGGRQGMSQAQRWGEEYDGIITGAPAFRQAQQQILHVYPATIEHTMEYYPPPCALEKIVNATIETCDPLDGKTDGIISRTDLCMLNFNITSTIGQSYYCAAETSSSLGFGAGTRRKRQANGEGSTTSTTPEQSGTITAKDVTVAQFVYDGLHDSDNQRAYLSWQIGSSLDDAEPAWDNNTSTWDLNIPSTGGVFVSKFIELVNASTITNLDNVTYDTLVEWMQIALVRYLDTLQTTLPDLTAFQSHGGKLLHYHGESDPSVPAASSVHYWQSVHSIMYPNQSLTETQEEFSDWYQLYMVPGGAHCSANSLQPGVWPSDNMDTMIDWVENGIKPTNLNATATSGFYAGQSQSLCQWPKRPLWSGNSSEPECVDDQEAVDTWTYSFPAFKLPVY